MTAEDRAVALDSSSPHSARMYDYYLGGKNHYEADAKAAEAVLQVMPEVRDAVRHNRAFMIRAARWLAAEAGIRQFLDIGTGIPTAPNLHQVVQEIAPEARIVYTDNDPIVLRYAQALLRSTPEGRTAYLHGDVTRPEEILGSQTLLDTIDLGRPVGLFLNALMHFVPSEQEPFKIVETLLDALAPGSYLALTHTTADFVDEETAQRIMGIYRAGGTPVAARPKDEIARFFTGLDLVEPGLVVSHLWRPEDPEAAAALHGSVTSSYAGVARKP